MDDLYRIVRARYEAGVSQQSIEADLSRVAEKLESVGEPADLVAVKNTTNCAPLRVWLSDLAFEKVLAVLGAIVGLILSIQKYGLNRLDSQKTKLEIRRLMNDLDGMKEPRPGDTA